CKLSPAILSSATCRCRLVRACSSRREITIPNLAHLSLSDCSRALMGNSLPADIRPLLRPERWGSLPDCAALFCRNRDSRATRKSCYGGCQRSARPLLSELLARMGKHLPPKWPEAATWPHGYSSFACIQRQALDHGSPTGFPRSCARPTRCN